MNKTARTTEARLEAELFAALCGPVQKQRQTTLRVRGGRFEIVELDSSGNTIEPVRCTCHGIVSFNCPLHCGGVT